MRNLMLALVALAGGLGGCIIHDHGPYGYHHRYYGPAVVVEAGHVHSEYCGHYYYGGSWYISHHHRHGPGCGHVYRSGMWIVVD